MAKVVLNNGLNVDALVLVKANLRDYMERSRSLIEKAEKADQPEHRDELVMLQNMIYFLSLDLQSLPVRKYKQKQN
jgi:hypothetical protein